MVLSIGVIYSLPNLYPAKPAIQIAYTDSGKSADQILLNQVTEILEDRSVGVESLGLKDNNIIAKFNSFEEASKIMDNAPENGKYLITRSINKSPLIKELNDIGV